MLRVIFSRLTIAQTPCLKTLHLVRLVISCSEFENPGPGLNLLSSCGAMVLGKADKKGEAVDRKVKASVEAAFHIKEMPSKSKGGKKTIPV